jgi:hypothetical protein
MRGLPQHAKDKTAVVGVAISPTSRCARHESEEQNAIDATCRLLHSACGRIAPAVSCVAKACFSFVEADLASCSDVNMFKLSRFTDSRSGMGLNCDDENGKRRLTVEQRHHTQLQHDAALWRLGRTCATVDLTKRWCCSAVINRVHDCRWTRHRRRRCQRSGGGQLARGGAASTGCDFPYSIVNRPTPRKRPASAPAPSTRRPQPRCARRGARARTTTTMRSPACRPTRFTLRRMKQQLRRQQGGAGCCTDKQIGL